MHDIDSLVSELEETVHVAESGANVVGWACILYGIAIFLA